MAFYDPRNPITFLSILKLKRCFLYIVYHYCIIPTPLPYILYRERATEKYRTQMAAEYSMSNPEKVVGEEAFQVQLLKKVLAEAADAFKTLPVTICVVW